MTLLKRSFGLAAVLTGATLIVFVIGHTFFVSADLELGPLLAGVTFGILFVLNGRRWLLNEIDLDVINVDIGDPRVVAAASTARKTLPRFWHYLEEVRFECYVKFPMQMKSGTLEHVWAVVHSRQSDEVSVSVVNDLVDEPLEQSARQSIRVSQIEDWQVIIGPDEIRGGYSVGALADVARARGFRLGRKSRKILSAFRDLQTQPRSW